MSSRLQFALALLFHAVLLIGLFKAHLLYLAVAWIIAMGAFLPFFNALRQVLEHRSETADPNIDYSVVPHGEVTRMFCPGLVGSTLGGAGFDRHLLHHWDPQVSYTRLAELERFLLDTKAVTAVSTKESYLHTFLRLFHE